MIFFIRNEPINDNFYYFSRKSFIQQRVEKLYGSTVKVLPFVPQRKSNDSLPITNSNGHSLKEQDEPLNSLPVMKHLRPEFAKQLEFFSPKKAVNGNGNGNTNGFKIISEAAENNKNGGEYLTNGEKNNTSKNNHSENNFSQNSSSNNSNSAPNCNKTIMATSIKNNKENGKVEAASQGSSNGLMRADDEVPDDNNAGHHFLAKLNYERSRILQLAADMEQELESLQANVRS